MFTAVQGHTLQVPAHENIHFVGKTLDKLQTAEGDKHQVCGGRENTVHTTQSPSTCNSLTLAR